VFGAGRSPLNGNDAIYVYAWGNNSRRRELRGRQCRVVARGAMRTVLVEFLDNGERVTTSARALRRVENTPPPPAPGRARP